MCGIAGLFSIKSSPTDRDPAASARAMVNTLAHRGPDGGDAWGDADAGVGFGHRRLAIIDLSATGAQPMHSADGRYVITFNGEVYNFEELRAELLSLGHNFRGTSDTEVMLAAVVEWGPERAIERFAGMFAFALFDRQTRTLRLVRDRLGVKPLYWTMTNGTLLFGSELRALMAYPSFRRDVDPEAVAAMLRFSYVPAPATIFRGVFKLPAGTILTVRAGSEPELAAYWRIDAVVAMRGQADVSFQAAVDGVESRLREAVRRRMIADVPVGAFLSGGIDSAAVVAMMQAVSPQPVRTFTIGFSDRAYNEADQARAVARYFRTDHTEVMLEPRAALDLVGDVPNWFDEPFADSSQLPTYLVSRMTRQHVTVALSGDGGDELFAGYPKYQWLERIWQHAGNLPAPLRAALGRAAGALPERGLQSLAKLWLDVGRAERFGEKTRRLAAALQAPDADEAAIALARVGYGDPSLVRGARGNLLPRAPAGLQAHLRDLTSRMQIQDMATYLPDDILTKVDRCAMAVALETREPFLDHELVEFVWSLPPRVHHGGEGSKGLLRAVLARHLPPLLMQQPKRGFSVPLADWLRGPLRAWASDLLSPSAVTHEGLFDAAKVDRLWQRHLSGTESNATGLWNILMMQAWSQRWLRV